MCLRTSRTLTLVVVLSLFVLAVVAGAGETVLRGDGNLKMSLTGGESVRVPGGPTVVQGTVTVSPRTDDGLPGTWTTFLVDGQSQYSTNDATPKLDIDTTELSEGPHTVRIDSLDGSRRVATTGDVALEVANQAVLSQLGQAAAGQPAFVKLHHKKILREVVWFNNREGDLETHGTMRANRVFITLTDLMRHIGGTVDWGPPGDLLLATRGGTTVRVIPGSNVVYVNGQAQEMDASTFRSANRTYVPVRAMCRFFGVKVDWDYHTDRAYVTYQVGGGEG